MYFTMWNFLKYMIKANPKEYCTVYILHGFFTLLTKNGFPFTK